MSLLAFFADVTRTHAELRNYAPAEAAWPEKFQCQHCGAEETLSIHGECQRCGSAAVVPVSSVGGVK